MPSSTIASSPAVTCSPEATTASYSRASCSAEASRAQATSSLVLPAMAETITATSWPASTSRFTWRATLRIRSTSATEVPPNFMTRRDMRSSGKAGYSIAARMRGGNSLGKARASALCGRPDLRQVPGDQLQVGEEALELALIRCGVRQSQQEQGMHGDESVDSGAHPHKLPARPLDDGVAPGQRARRGRAERHGQLRLQQAQLVVQPPGAGLDLGIVRLLVDAAL